MSYKAKKNKLQKLSDNLSKLQHFCVDNEPPQVPSLLQFGKVGR